MLFMEPMAHPLTILFHRVVRSAHTPDEFPILPRDVAWMEDKLGARIRPINHLSFPAGIVSSLVLGAADNPLMRAADRIDFALAGRRRLRAYGRQGIVLVEKIAL